MKPTASSTSWLSCCRSSCFRRRRCRRSDGRLPDPSAASAVDSDAERLTGCCEVPADERPPTSNGCRTDVLEDDDEKVLLEVGTRCSTEDGDGDGDVVDGAISESVSVTATAAAAATTFLGGGGG